MRAGRVLLVRRSEHLDRAPGRWAYPGGFVEQGETAEQAALRETLEEVGVRARIRGIVGRPHTLLDPHHVVIAFRGETDGDPEPGDEVAEVRWFAPAEIPWSDIAFPSTEVALRALLAEGLDGPPSHPHDPVLSTPTGARRLPRHCLRCGGQMRASLYGEQGHASCRACAAPYWANPAVAASLLALREDRVLLGRRTHPSRGRGLWAAPAGFVEPGESAEDAAEREILEEAGVRGRVDGLVSVYSGAEHVEISYFGTADGVPQPSPEMSELHWFSREAIPWQDLFDTCGASLERLIARGLL